MTGLIWYIPHIPLFFILCFGCRPHHQLAASNEPPDFPSDALFIHHLFFPTPISFSVKKRPPQAGVFSYRKALNIEQMYDIIETDS